MTPDHPGREDPWPPVAVQTFLSSDRRCERVPVDTSYAATVVERIADEEGVHTLFAAAQERWEKANTESYDAARKAVEMLLLAHGWRVRTTPGAHAAVTDVVAAWLGAAAPPGPRIAQKFGAARKARHDHEYPSSNAFRRSERELRELSLDNIRLYNLVRGTLGLAEREDLVPTDDNVRQYASRIPPPSE